MGARISARLPALILLALLFVLAGVLLQRPPQSLLQLSRMAGLDTQQAHAAAFPALFLAALFLAFVLIHTIDRLLAGDGLSHRILRSEHSAMVSRGYRYDPQVVQGLLTKQAIFTALAMALLVTVAGALLFHTRPMAPERALLLTWVAVGLVLTLLLALTSITCYTHALQFHWQDRYGKGLLRLGSKLDIASFYCLSASLLLAVGLWQPSGTYAFGLFYAILLYRYYFFSVPAA